jgi:hypothetical protein
VTTDRVTGLPEQLAREDDHADGGEGGPECGLHDLVRTYFPARVPTVPPIRTPGTDHATTYHTGVAASAWTAAYGTAGLTRPRTSRRR